MSSADKRSVATDALETLGYVISEKEARDAIHLAVEPVIAGETLQPGQHIGLTAGKIATSSEPHLGIVDPFLVQPVRANERFWLVVYPRQIRSLRHVWEHPAFPASGADAGLAVGDKAASEQWLREFAEIPEDDEDSKYERILDAAERARGEEYFSIGGVVLQGTIPLEFWTHIEVVTGKRFPLAERPTYFSCSC